MIIQRVEIVFSIIKNDNPKKRAKRLKALLDRLDQLEQSEWSGNSVKIQIGTPRARPRKYGSLPPIGATGTTGKFFPPIGATGTTGKQ